MRYSRTTPGPRFLTSTAVVLAEAIKFVISTGIYTYRKSERSVQEDDLLEKTIVEANTKLWRSVFSDLFGKRSDFLLLLIPSILYTITNNLQFIAASHLDAATYQVAYQGKLITTAILAVIIVGQKLILIKWFSIVTLALGIACISLSTDATSTSSGPARAASDLQGNRNIGLLAVGVSCILSSLAGISFEFVLKRHRRTSTSTSTWPEPDYTAMWQRNAQLSLGGFLLATAGALLWHGPQIRHNGFSHGYTSIVWITILLQAFVGVVVSVVIASADNILKGFATSLSVVVSTFVSVFFFDFVVTRNFLYGSVLVLLSTHMYGLPESVVADPDRPDELGAETMCTCEERPGYLLAREVSARSNEEYDKAGEQLETEVNDWNDEKGKLLWGDV
ncbi:hypothetical protein PMZ80_000801 [Knufia obscura]|uniref:Uncharacterized protein n=2 Tax=Knufia TaxID=430999 RepID=A0AAN8E9N3_9EURO|nr:hypothetical protein PMZ80_000801 [Knufia obscura]KAK5949934.1 hypothetical protein OHC33_009119 [Knufia fluminis]